MPFIEVTTIATLTRDPELRVTPKGTSICQFGLAINKRWKDEAGQDREDVCFIDAEAWGKQGETMNKFFRKGHPIYIRGTLKQDTWEDKTTQQRRSKHKIVVERFEFIRGKEEGEQPVSAPAADAPAPARPRQAVLPGNQVPF